MIASHLCQCCHASKPAKLREEASHWHASTLANLRLVASHESLRRGLIKTKACHPKLDVSVHLSSVTHSANMHLCPSTCTPIPYDMPMFSEDPLPKVAKMGTHTCAPICLCNIVLQHTLQASSCRLNHCLIDWSPCSYILTLGLFKKFLEHPNNNVGHISIVHSCMFVYLLCTLWHRWVACQVGFGFRMHEGVTFHIYCNMLHTTTCSSGSSKTSLLSLATNLGSSHDCMSVRWLFLLVYGGLFVPYKEASHPFNREGGSKLACRCTLVCAL